MKRIVHSGEPAWLEKRFPGEEKIYGTYRDLGKAHGTEQFAVRVTRLLPGETNTKYHAHSRSEEWFYVLSGRCKVVIEGEWHTIRPGDSVHTPPGVMHWFINDGEEPCDILMLGTNDLDDRVTREPEPPLPTASTKSER